MASDLLGLVEAAYRVELSEEAWLEGIARAGGDIFDRGLGTAAYVYSFAETEPAIKRVTFHGNFDPAWLPKFLERMGQGPDLIESAPTDWKAWLHLPCGMAASIPGLGKMAAAFDAFGGARDVFAINGRDPLGFGVWLGVPQKKSRTLTAAELDVYSRVSTHLAAGYRVRRMLAESGSKRVEARIEPNGKIADANGDATSQDAREALRRATLGMERARSSNGRKEIDSATRAWRGLVDGRWTLLDHFESDGKRFVVATNNEVSIRKPRPLSARERQVLAFAAMGQSNKEIAYALGLSAATIRVLLARASQKLGVRGRDETIAKFNLLARS